MNRLLMFQGRKLFRACVLRGGEGNLFAHDL